MTHWYDIFTFIRDGITGSELLGMVLVLGMVLLITFVQLKETGSSKRLDFSWLFLDPITQRVSRTGLTTFGGFLLGCWVVVDAEQSARLDWAFFGTFLLYCAGVRAIEAWKPPSPGITQTSSSSTTVVTAPPVDPASPKGDD